MTELFESIKTGETPIVVEQVVADIDEIVRHVRFDGWQGTHAGEREIKKALRKTLFKYQLHSSVCLSYSPDLPNKIAVAVWTSPLGIVSFI